MLSGVEETEWRLGWRKQNGGQGGGNRMEVGVEEPEWRSGWDRGIGDRIPGYQHDMVMTTCTDMG
jgi:hypothetical protein